MSGPKSGHVTISDRERLEAERRRREEREAEELERRELACERLGFAAPSATAQAHASRAGCIAFTYGWDAPEIERICFYVAGFQRDEVPDYHPNLRLFAREAPALVLSVEADGLGNFYSTDPLPLPDTPLFPTVYGPGGVGKNFMPFPTSSGACNVCHVGGAVVSVPAA